MGLLVQLVIAMPLVRAVYNVPIQLDNVHVMLDTKELNVMRLVVAMVPVQVVQHVISLQVNVLAMLVILDTQELHATLVTLTTTE